jgi:hypothetical protein
MVKVTTTMTTTRIIFLAMKAMALDRSAFLFRLLT